MAEDQNVNNELLNPIPNSYSNMQNGPLPGSNFRYETIEDLPIPNELEALDPALDNQYVNMLNAAAPKINSYAAAPMGNINSPYPTMAGDTYDPRKQQLPPDLTTSDGISRFLNESDFEAREVTADIPVIEDPIYASQKATNFARYYEHPNFNELGFHPYSNNEEYYNANSTWFDDGRRMWDQFKSLTGTGFMSGYRNAANYISGENAWWGTGVDLESAEEYAKAFEIGSTSREGVVPFLQNTGLNFAYTTGIMGSIALEELALFGIAALQGGLNPASDAAAIVRTGYNIGRLGKAISNSFTVGKMFNASRNMVRNLKNIDKARKFHESVRIGGNFLGDLLLPNTIDAFRGLNTAKNVGQNLHNLSKASKVFGGFYRDMRSINIALSESNMEAGFVYNDMIANGIAIKQEQNNGQPLSTEDMLDIQEKADRAAFATANLNAPIIFLSNQIVLGNMVGNRAIRKLLQKPVKGYAGRVLRNKSVVDASGDIVTKGFDEVSGGFITRGIKRIKATGAKGGLKSLGGASLRFFAANLAEGTQELYQEAVQVGTQKYFTEMLKDPTSSAYDYFSIAINDAVSSQMSQRGFETFMSGFIIGGLGNATSTAVFQGIPNLYNSGALAAPFSKSAREKYDAYKTNKEKLKNEYIEGLNKSWNDIKDNPYSTLFNSDKLGLAVQKSVAQSLDKNDLDTYEEVQEKDYSKFFELYRIFSTGRQGEFKSMIEDLTKLTDEELVQAYRDKIRAGDGASEIRGSLEGMISEIDRMEERFEKLNNTYPNPRDPDQYKKGSRQYIDELQAQAAYDHYRFLYLFTETSFDRAVSRFDSIFQELSSDPVFKNLAASDLTVLLTPESLENEIKTLRLEIDSLEDSADNKKIRDEKIKKEKILRKYSEKLKSSIDKQTNEYDRLEMQNNLASVYEEYLKYLSSVKGEFVDNDKAGTAFEKIIDGYSLKNDGNVLYRAIQVLNDPKAFDDIISRTREVYRNIYKNQRQIFKSSIDRYISQAEKNTFLNKLYKEGIYMSPESVQEFNKDNIDTKKLVFFTEDGPVNPIENPEAQKLIDSITTIFNETRTEPVEEEQEEAPVKDDFDTSTETKLDEDIQEETPDWTDFSVENITDKEHPLLIKLLNDYYNRNINIQDGINQVVTQDKWRNSEEAQKIIRAYKNVKKLWGATLEENDPNYIIDKGFDKWLASNIDNNLVIRALQQANLNISDLIEYKKKSTRELYKPEAEDAFVDIYIRRGKVDKSLVQYDIRDKNNQKFKKPLLDKANAQSEYTTEEGAVQARNRIKNILKKSQTYTFDGVDLSYGNYVISTEGNDKGEKFIVASETSDVTNRNYITLVPEAQYQILADKSLIDNNIDLPRVRPGEFKNRYEKLDVNFTTENPNAAKVNFKEPIQSYVIGKSQREILTTIKTVLNKEDINKLELVVKKNPKGGDRIGPLEKNNKPETRNNKIQKKKETYSIAIRIPQELRGKVNNKLSEAEQDVLKKEDYIFAYIRNNSYDFIVNNKPVKDIIQLNDQELADFIDVKVYRKFGGPKDIELNDRLVKHRFRSNIATQQAFINAIEEKLKGKESAVFKMSEFYNAERKKGIFLENEGGLMDYTDNFDVKLNQLSSDNYDGNYVLMENLIFEDVYGNTQRTSNVFIRPKEGDELTFTEDQEFQQRVIDESAEQNPQLYNNATFVRYVAIVKQENDIISYIPLKQRLLDEGELDGIIRKIVENAAEVREINKTNQEEARARAIMYSKNINEDLYVSSNTPNVITNINIAANGSVYIKPFFRLFNEEGVAIPQSQIIPSDYIFKTPEELQAIADSENKRELFKNIFIEQQEAINNLAKAKFQDPNTPSDLKSLYSTVANYKISDLLVSFPKDVTLDTLLEYTATNISEKIRKENSLQLKADSVTIQAVKDASSIKAAVKDTPKNIQKADTDKVELTQQTSEVKRSAGVKELISIYTGGALFFNIDAPGLEVAESLKANGVTLEEAKAAIPTLGGKIKKWFQRGVDYLQAEKKPATELRKMMMETFQGSGAELQAEVQSLNQALQSDSLTKEKRRELRTKLNDALKKLTTISNKILNAPISNYSNENITKINEFVDFMNKNLPDFIGLDNLENLAENLRATGQVGAFVMSLEKLAGGFKLNGKIYTTPSSPFKYHEAFHAVFRMLLTPEQQAIYYKKAATEVRSKLKKEGKTLAKELEVFKLSNEKNSELSYDRLKKLYLEEYMADNFDAFKTKPRSVKTDSFIKSLYNNIIEFIKYVLRRFRSSDLQTLYEKIDSGKFKSSSIESNYFTSQAGLGVTLQADKIIPKKRVLDFENQKFGFEYLDTSIARTLIASIGADVINKEKQSNAFVELFDINKAVSKSIEDFANLYDPNNSIYDNKSEKDKDLIAEINSAFVDFPEFIEDGVIEYLKSFDLKIQTIEDLNDDEESEVGLRYVYEYNKSPDMIGGFNNLPLFLRKYIGTTTLNETDWFGNEYLKDGVKLRVPVDYAKAYNGFLKAAKNTSDPNKIIQNLYFYSAGNPHMAAVMNRFFEDIGVDVIEDGLTDFSSLKDPELYVKFVKGFENYVADYLFIHRSSNDGKVVTYSAANRDDANTQFSNWSGAYMTAYNTILKDQSNINKISKTLESFQKLYVRSSIDDSSLDNYLSTVINDIRKFLGISLSLNYLRNSVLRSIAGNENSKLTEIQQSFIYAYKDEGVLLQDDLRTLRGQIVKRQNIFDDRLGMTSRLKRMSVENSYFDETVGASVFLNPENNFVYAHQLPSYHFKKVQSLNDPAGDGSKLNAIKESNPYLRLNFLINSPLFQSLSAEDRLKILKVSGTKTSLRIDYNADYSIVTNESKLNEDGTKYGDLTANEFMTMLINLYTASFNNAKEKVTEVETENGLSSAVSPILIRVIEASNQSDMISLPVIKAVNKTGNVNSITAEARNAVINNIISEFERIKRELNPNTQTYNNETRQGDLIVGYNATSDGLNFDPKGRAFQFHNTGKLLGGYKNIMETIVNENPDIKFDELIIKSGFKSKNSFAGYIKNKLDTGFLEFYNKLKELEIIDEKGESTEISSYITRGLVGKDDNVTDKTIESMAKLNLRENDLEFNLKQIFLNQYINAVAINQILLGDQAKTLKDIVDAVKRAKGQTGQGVSGSLDVYDEAHNIKPVDNISLVAFTEPTQLSKVQGSSNIIDQADAQGYITAKAFKYLQYATGRMQNEGQFNLLNDVERGTALRTRGEVYFGTDQLKGLDKQNAMINSKKYMYFDGETYAKTSFFTLTKEFTSKGENFSEPKPSREALHYLRIRLEEIEEASSGNTLGIALPASGLKMQKLNLQDANEITSPEGSIDQDKVNLLSPGDMRLQVINPSNKLEMADPVQVKTLITAEQDPNDKDIQDTISKYNDAIKNRQDLNFKNLSNLLKINHASFLKYAQGSLDSSQSNSQLREFFEIGEDGFSLYELNNPVSYKKLEQLLFNYLSKNTVKERLPGISAAQVSDFGINVYRRIYSLDEDGQLDRQEVIRDNFFEANFSKDDIVPFDINSENFSQLSGLIEQSAGKGIIIIDKLRHNLKDENGLRYTELLSAPHHKSVYNFNKQTKVNIIPDIIAKTFAIRIPSQDKHSSLYGRIVDFLPAYYGSNVVTSREYVEISGFDFDIDKLYIHIKEFYFDNNEFKEYKNNFEDYARYVNDKVLKSGTIYNDALETLKYAKVENSDLTDKKSLLDKKSILVLSLLGLPTNKNAFLLYTKDGKSPYSAVYNNESLDYKTKLLGNKYISEAEKGQTPIAHQPAALTAIEEVWEKVQTIPAIANAAIEESLLDESILSQYYSFKANKGGAAGIGPIVKSNVVLSLLSEKGQVVSAHPGVKNLYSAGHINFNNKVYNRFESDKKGTKIRKQDIISSIITMMTDNAKERYADKIGLNLRNVGVAGNMISLGIPLYETVLLLNHPVIKRAYAQSDVSPGNYVKRELRLIANKTKTKTFKGETVTTEMLLNGINNENSKGKAAILVQFLRVNRVAYATNKLSSVFSLVNGFGKSLKDLEALELDLQFLGLERVRSDERSPILPNLDLNLEDTWQYNMINIYDAVQENILPDFLLTSSVGFSKIKNSVLNQIEEKTAVIIEDKLNLDILTYLINQAYINNGRKTNTRYIQTLSNSLLYKDFLGDHPTIVDLVKQGRKIISEEFNEPNFFFDTFVSEHLATDMGNKLGIDYLSSNTYMFLNDSDKINLQSSFASLYGNPNTRDIANTMVNYLIVKDGLTYSAGGLIQAVSPFAITEYLRQASNVKEALNNNKEEQIQDVFGMSLAEMNDDFMNGYFKSNVNRDIIIPVNKIKIITKGELKGKYEILDTKQVFLPGVGPVDEFFDKLYASYTFINEQTGLSNTLYLEKDIQTDESERVYSVYQMEGSNGQVGTGFQFGPRPTNKNIGKVINLANKQQEPIVQQPVTKSSQQKLIDAINNGDIIESNGESVTTVPATPTQESYQISMADIDTSPEANQDPLGKAKAAQQSSKIPTTTIISGGQTGVDQIGLEVGQELGIKTGGTVPKGFKTEKGPDPSLSRFGVVESPSASYPVRTENNVIDSDGTIYFATDTKSAGLGATRRFAIKHNKPFLLNPTAEQLRKFLADNNIQTLNVAGNRGSKLTTQQQTNIKNILTTALKASTPQTSEVKEGVSVTDLPKSKAPNLASESAQDAFKAAALAGKLQSQGEASSDEFLLNKADEFMKSNFDNNQDMRNKLRDNGITDAQSLIDKYKEAKNIDSSLNINSYLDNVIKKCL